MNQKCDICKTRDAVILINGKGNYCYECHNRMALERSGLDDDYDYSHTMAIMEPDGTMHMFEVNHIILGDIVSWEAVEQGGDYHFGYISELGGSGREAARNFSRKIADGVLTKTIESGKGASFLKNKGNIHISEDDDMNTVFVIDGEMYYPEEIAGLFATYNSFNIQYRVCDISEPLLGKDEYLVPVKITGDGLVEELENLIGLFAEDGFMDYDLVYKFDDMFYDLTDRLEVLRDNVPEVAADAGRRMIEMLENIETDDDMFPETEVECIRRICERR